MYHESTTPKAGLDARLLQTLFQPTVDALDRGSRNQTMLPVRGVSYEPER